MVIRRIVGWLVLVRALSPGALAAQPAKPPTPVEAAVAAIGSPTQPCAALAGFARSHGIPLDGVDQATEGVVLNPGDSVTALVTLIEKSRRTEWLLYVRADGQGPSTTNKPSKIVMHSTTGRKFEFESTRVAASIRTLGPYDVSDQKRKLKPTDKTARVSLQQGYLALGLDNAAKAAMRLRKSSKTKSGLAYGPRPFGDKALARGRELTNIVQLTLEEERALGGAGPALESYFTIVQQTEGLSDILFKLVDLPSMWSIARNRGVTANFQFGNKEIRERQVEAGSPAIYEIPLALELNGRAALHITLVATRPQPPLLACAGIMGLVAARPGAKDTWLAVQLLSAKRASTATNSVASTSTE
jgi:hypothetical protein